MAIVGGGHNALTAAAYLARAGVDTTVLERLPHVGGAAVSARAFPGVDARLSRYSYLVSLLPRRIIDDLGLRVRLARRRYSSYTPVPGSDTGLLIDEHDAEGTRASFERIGAGADVDAVAAWHARVARLARVVAPTLTEPLPLAGALRDAAGPDSAWREIVEQPIGTSLRAVATHPLVRGMLATDALIGTFAPLDGDLAETLAANRCFLYHVIGQGTGAWDVPIGGMGAITGELERAARGAGVRIVTDASVDAVTPDGEVRWTHGDASHRDGFDLVLSGVAPHVLDRLRAAGVGSEPSRGAVPRPEGAQVKVNMVLRRLPRLRGDITPEAAFGGTFHVHESADELEGAYAAASAGRVPDPLPCEIYCHSLADPSILGPELRSAGAHTLTVFGLHVPDRLLDGRDADVARGELQAAVLRSLDGVLAEPMEPLLLADTHGAPCIETRTTRDIEQSLAMPGGHIFHGDLDWPWRERPAASVAAAWGVETPDERILHAASGSVRGGAVSGLGGFAAAQAALELLPA